MKALKVAVLAAGIVLLGAKGLASFKHAGRPQEAAQVRPDNPDLSQVVERVGADYRCREAPYRKVCRYVF